MRKFFALYKNEMTKTSRKVSVIIILIIMIVGIVVFGGLVSLLEPASTSNNQNAQNNIVIDKQNSQDEIDTQKKALASIEDQMKTATGSDLASLESQKESAQSQIDKLQYAMDHGIVSGSTGYLSDALDLLYTDKDSLNSLISVPSDSLSTAQKSQITTLQGTISRLQNVLDNRDFKEYISILNDEVNSSDKPADEKKISLESNAIRLKANLTGVSDPASSTTDNSAQMISQLENDKLSLLYNLDYSNNMKPLTQNDRNNIKNDIAVNTYELEKNIDTVTPKSGSTVRDSAMSGMAGFGMFMIVILMMILAGGSVSQEMSTGSIKSLIISPSKRWKIFVAKFVSLLTVGIVSSLLLYLVVNIFYGICFGFSSGSPYIYAINGVAHELNFYVLNLAKLFASFVQVLVFMMFALMLSVITRNTAASVGISIAAYFGGGLVSPFLLIFARGDWLKFLPFNNLDFASKLFPNSATAGVTNLSSMGTANTSITFSVCYVLVLLICMFYTALDSFNRRDIK